MIRDLKRVGATAVGLLGLAAAPAAAFESGEVYWAPGACDAPPCHVNVVDAGFGTVTPSATVDLAPGQFAWESDFSAVYLSQFGSSSILRITSSGSSSTFATGIAGATGLLMTSGGTLLAVSHGDGAVYDVTLGGDYSNALPVASGFTTPRNLLERSDGHILLVDQTARTVFDIGDAGGFNEAAIPFAFGFTIGAYDLVEDASGNLFLSTRLGIYEISDGGDFGSASPFAWGRFLVGLTVDGAGRLVASEFETGDVYDISGGGDVSGALAVASVPNGLGDSALDTVPPGAPEAPQVPVLGPLGYGVVASLLLASSRRSCSR